MSGRKRWTHLDQMVASGMEQIADNRRVVMNTERATEDQKRRANEIVAMTLGLYAATTPRDDPGAHFGYQCALLAITHGDAREARLRDLRPGFDQAGDAFRKLSEVAGAARHPFGNGNF